MISYTNDPQAHNGYPSEPDKGSAGEDSSSASYPHIINVGDTTVRLRFNNTASLSTQLASAFSAMLR